MTKGCRVSLLMEKCFADPCADTVFRNLAAAKKACSSLHSFGLDYVRYVAGQMHKTCCKVSVSDLETVIWIDCTKMGVISQSEVNLIGDVCDKMLFKNPSREFLRREFAVNCLPGSCLPLSTALCFDAGSKPKIRVCVLICPGSVLVLIPPLLVGADSGGSLRKDIRSMSVR